MGWKSELLDQPRGMLTKPDRKYLLRAEAREGLSANADAQKRHRIRRRVRSAVADFMAVDALNQSELDLILSEGGGDALSTDQLIMGVESMIRFVVKVTSPTAFQEIVSDELRRVLVRQIIELEGKFPVLDVGFEYGISEYIALDELKRRFDEGEGLTRVQVEALWHIGEISSEAADSYENISDTQYGIPDSSEGDAPEDADSDVSRADEGGGTFSDEYLLGLDASELRRLLFARVIDDERFAEIVQKRSAPTPPTVDHPRPASD